MKIERLSMQLDPDPSRVIPRFFGPGDEDRLRAIIERIRVIDHSPFRGMLGELRSKYQVKHPDFDSFAESNFEAIKGAVDRVRPLRKFVIIKQRRQICDWA